MKIIGITGSIGMGKSTVSGLLRFLGVPVFDSDACVRGALESLAKNDILRAFPSVAAYPSSGSAKIDRQALGRLVFDDDRARQSLEAILHPIVWSEQDKFIKHTQRAKHDIVGLDIPLLFETGRHNICNKTICVTAPFFIQRCRVLKRNGMTEDKFQKIVNAQYPDSHKRIMSDFVVQTGLGRDFTLQQIKKILRHMG
jgi:dephospho-CoA kinase